tara:strand:- start:1753 stop:2406 length:654 start_codon:yes stop_codon:yes gene_type:complete
MKYYQLGKFNTIVAKVPDTSERSIELTAKIGWDDDIENFKRSVETLRPLNIPMYTKNRLEFAFGKLIEIDKAAYDDSLQAINEYNAEQDRVMQEIENTPLPEIREYITTFPINHPNVASYKDINRLWSALWIIRDPDYETEGGQEFSRATEEEEIEDIRSIYGILKSATTDRRIIPSILNVINEGLDQEEQDAMSSRSVDLTRGETSPTLDGGDTDG